MFGGKVADQRFSGSAAAPAQSQRRAGAATAYTGGVATNGQSFVSQRWQQSPIHGRWESVRCKQVTARSALQARHCLTDHAHLHTFLAQRLSALRLRVCLWTNFKICGLCKAQCCPNRGQVCCHVTLVCWAWYYGPTHWTLQTESDSPARSCVR